MDSWEFAEELAYHLYFDPLDEPWRRTEIVAMAAWNPHARRSQRLRPGRAVPTLKKRFDIEPTQEMNRANALMLTAIIEGMRQCGQVVEAIGGAK
jgi:hypothetical protein